MKKTAAQLIDEMMSLVVKSAKTTATQDAIALKPASKAIKTLVQAKQLQAGQYAAYMRYSEISFVLVREMIGSTVALVSSVWYDSDDGTWTASEYINPVLADTITPLSLLPTPDNIDDFIVSSAKSVHFAKHDKLRIEKKQDDPEPQPPNDPEPNNELAYELDDTVKFTDDEGIERVGVVEAVDLDGKMATVRVMAVTGDITEPTDMVLNMGWDRLSPFDESTATPEDEVEPDEAGSTDASGNPKSANSSGVVVGDFVSFVTLDGRTKGMVTSVADQTAHIEVYALAGKEYEATGVVVSHSTDVLTRIDTPQIAEQKRKIVAKFNDVRTKEIDTDCGQMGYIYGDGSVYGNTDLGGDIVPKGAFTQSLTHNNGIFQSYWDHGWTTETLAGVAICTDAERSLKTEIRVPLWIDKCRQNYEQVKFQLSQGAKMGLSIGYDPIKTSPGANGTRYLNEIKLLEVSVTPMPMNTQALIESVKSRKAVYAQKADRWKQRPATITAPKAPVQKSIDAPDLGSQVAHDDAQDWALVIAELKQLTSLVTTK